MPHAYAVARHLDTKTRLAPVPSLGVIPIVANQWIFLVHREVRLECHSSPRGLVATCCEVSWQAIIKLGNPHSHFLSARLGPVMLTSMTRRISRTESCYRFAGESIAGWDGSASGPWPA